MFGKTRRETAAYYVCAPRKGYRPDDHPASIWVREDAVLPVLRQSLAHHVFGPYREALLGTDLAETAQNARLEHDRRLAALRRALTDLDSRGRRLARSLELIDDPDPDFIRDINERRAELRQERRRTETALADGERHAVQAPNPDLLAGLPVGVPDLDRLPDHLTRALFETLRLKITYDRVANRATCQVTLGAETTDTVAATAEQAIDTAEGED